MSDEEDDYLKVVIEALAKVFHMSWMEWSQEIANSEIISEKRLARWEKYWIPYEQLPKEVKEQDRKYARVAFTMLGLSLPQHKNKKKGNK